MVIFLKQRIFLPSSTAFTENLLIRWLLGVPYLFAPFMSCACREHVLLIKKKLAIKLRIRQNSGYLLETTQIFAFVYCFYREFADSMAAGGTLPLYPFHVHYWSAPLKILLAPQGLFQIITIKLSIKAFLTKHNCRRNCWEFTDQHPWSLWPQG